MSILFLLIITVFNLNSFLCKLNTISDSAVQTRINDGIEANDEEYPFIARIRDYKNKPEIFCTGSIIHENWILTAGHCLSEDPQKVTVGTTSANGEGGQTYEIKKTYIPDNYNVWAGVDTKTGKLTRYYSDNDVGLIQLQKPINFSQQSVGKISLDNDTRSHESNIQIFIGWGKTYKKAYSPAQILQLGEGSVISTAKCQEAEPAWVISNSLHICTSPDFDSGICPGDAGAPLLTFATKKQIAIANHGSCGKKMPSVFQRVSAHYKWIKETIEKQGDKLSEI